MPAPTRIPIDPNLIKLVKKLDSFSQIELDQLKSALEQIASSALTSQQSGPVKLS
jgi:hypothetical protein